jgi:hypothetical protein
MAGRSIFLPRSPAPIIRAQACEGFGDLIDPADDSHFTNSTAIWHVRGHQKKTEKETAF